MTATHAASPLRSSLRHPILLPAVAGAAVSVALGTYAQVHTPTGAAIARLGFGSVLAMKAWCTTVAAVLLLAQIGSALWMWGRLPGAAAAPTWLPALHRWLGTVAFCVTLPVAYHCLWSLGFASTDLRVFVHSMLGCAFYGAFTTKMLLLRARRLPAWAIPVAGGLLAVVLAALWTTSSLWYFRTFGFPAA